LTDQPGSHEELRIPGVRYRKEKRTRLEPVTINGVTEYHEVTYEACVPMPPRDWDAILLRGAICVTLAVTAWSVLWTASSIGGLLSKTVHQTVAYGVATVFDLTWMACQAIEWTLREDPERARAVRNAGWVALLIAMGAVVADGIDSGEPVTGGAGAAVSLFAKGLWLALMLRFAVPLSPDVSHWLRKQRERVTVQMALARELDRLRKQRAYARLVYGADFDTAAEIGRADAPPAIRTPVPDQAPEEADAGPSASAAPPPPAASPVPPVPGSATGSGPAARGPVPPLPPGVAPMRPPISAVVTAVLDREPGISDEDLNERVRVACGNRKNLAETVARYRREYNRKKGRKAS